MSALRPSRTPPPMLLCVMSLASASPFIVCVCPPAQMAVGGKVIFTQYVDKSSQNTMQTIGNSHSKGAGMSGAFSGLSFGASHSMANAFNQMTQQEAASEYGGSNINVIGGASLSRALARGR